MSPFIDDNFLLESPAAIRLFHEYAEDLPIIDYHCHLSPAQVANDQRFENLTQIWLYGDHYKWRAMRTNGVPEHLITGQASDLEKFEAWAATVPFTLRNPLYHWTHMELNRPFGISDRLLDKQTAEGIWNECNEKLSQPEFSCRGIMKQMKVVLVATTDDPIDSLEHHKKIAEDADFDISVVPAFRPDKCLMVEDPSFFNGWVDQLQAASDIDVTDFKSFLDALRKRRDFFHQHGCRLSDHGIETAYAEDCTAAQAAAIFTKVRNGKKPDATEALQFKSAMLLELGRMYHEKGWTQQFHLGALRNNNSRLFRELGADTGFDSIGDFEIARPLSHMLDRLDETDQLCQTILYNLNPRDNELFATMIGNFQDGSTPGKMQFGSGWWFLDQMDGMTKQMNALSNMGLLSRFVGMLTDSRSFLSYTRHEYFRRLLCNLLGEEMERGWLPNDLALIGTMVKDISYFNAASYFGFNIPELKQ